MTAEPTWEPSAAGERNSRIIALRKAGVGPREIARRMGLSSSTVAGVLFRAGATQPIGGRGNGVAGPIAEIIRQAVANGEAPKSAALRWGLHYTTVYRLIAAHQADAPR